MARNKVKVVTAYVDLGLLKRPNGEFHTLGKQLIAATSARVIAFENFPYKKCWLVPEAAHLPPANARAEDRFATQEEHLRSNIIQHCPVQWVTLAGEIDHDVDVFVWMGYSLFKQGGFTGKVIYPEHVKQFLDRVEEYDFKDIPFPGMTPHSEQPIAVHGDNWRFCGSVVIFPRRFMYQMAKSYMSCTRKFIQQHQCVPLDLAIWPEVERTSGLPFRWYRAEYDYTQLTNFPG